MFTGLSAFPLTPLRNGRIDEGAFDRLVERLALAADDAEVVQLSERLEPIWALLRADGRSPDQRTKIGWSFRLLRISNISNTMAPQLVFA